MFIKSNSNKNKNPKQNGRTKRSHLGGKKIRMTKKEIISIEIIAIMFVGLLHLHLLNEIRDTKLQVLELREALSTTMEMSEWMVNAK